MAVHQLEITTENLLNAVAQMPESEFNRFVANAKKLRTNHKNSTKEIELIHKINTIYSVEKRQRFNHLNEKFQQENITPKEYKELLKLSDEFEIRNAKKLKYLGEIAKIRRQSLREVMKDLEIKAEAN